MPDVDKTAGLVAFYASYGEVVYARCRQMLGDAAAAEDATQETFLRVQRHIDKVPPAEEALPWLYRIATNLCLNEIKKAKLRPALFALPPERQGASLQDLLADRDLVGRLVARLPPKVRAVAWLYHVDGMGQEEVATVLNVSRRTVATRLEQFAERARKFLIASGIKPADEGKR